MSSPTPLPSMDLIMKMPYAIRAVTLRKDTRSGKYILKNGTADLFHPPKFIQRKDGEKASGEKESCGD